MYYAICIMQYVLCNMYYAISVNLLGREERDDVHLYENENAVNYVLGHLIFNRVVVCEHGNEEAYPDAVIHDVLRALEFLDALLVREAFM